MNIRDRVRALERVLQPEDAYRLVFVPQGTDQAAEIARYRERTGYRGPVICIDETDARLKGAEERTWQR